ncbi:hypothetical protein ACJX0J_040822, partial [Zea mays]
SSLPPTWRRVQFCTGSACICGETNQTRRRNSNRNRTQRRAQRPAAPSGRHVQGCLRKPMQMLSKSAANFCEYLLQ